MPVRNGRGRRSAYLTESQRSHCAYISLSVHVVSISSGSTNHARYTYRFTMDVTTRRKVGPPSIVSCLPSYREGAHSECLKVVFIRGSEYCPTSETSEENPHLGRPPQVAICVVHVFRLPSIYTYIYVCILTCMKSHSS